MTFTATPAGVPRQRSLGVGYAARFTVGVAASQGESEQWRYGWTDEAGACGDGVAEGATCERDALIVALAAALTTCDLARPLEFRVPDEELASALTDNAVELLAPLLATCDVSFPWHPAARSGQLVRKARQCARGASALQSVPTGAPAEPRRPDTAPPSRELVFAATDGSKGRGPMCGWAFITSNGRHRSGICHGSVLASELTAIDMLLRYTPRNTPLRVRVDSRPALALLRDSATFAARGWVTTDGNPVPHRHLLASILRQRAGREVTFKWVRGHAGDPLNDAADRLARLARRGEESARGGQPIPADVAQQLVAGILADLKAATLSDATVAA